MVNPDTAASPLGSAPSQGQSSAPDSTPTSLPTDNAALPQTDAEVEQAPMAAVEPGFLDNPDDLYACCEKTIEDHGINNPMMVCAGCKQIIKRFDNPKSFQAYIKFCRSRHRKVYATTVPPWYIVIFHSYATFST